MTYAHRVVNRENSIYERLTKSQYSNNRTSYERKISMVARPKIGSSNQASLETKPKKLDSNQQNALFFLHIDSKKQKELYAAKKHLRTVLVGGFKLDTQRIKNDFEREVLKTQEEFKKNLKRPKSKKNFSNLLKNISNLFDIQKKLQSQNVITEDLGKMPEKQIENTTQALRNIFDLKQIAYQQINILDLVDNTDLTGNDLYAEESLLVNTLNKTSVQQRFTHTLQKVLQTAGSLKNPRVVIREVNKDSIYRNARIIHTNSGEKTLKTAIKILEIDCIAQMLIEKNLDKLNARY